MSSFQKKLYLERTPFKTKVHINYKHHHHLLSDIFVTSCKMIHWQSSDLLTQTSTLNSNLISALTLVTGHVCWNMQIDFNASLFHVGWVPEVCKTFYWALFHWPLWCKCTGCRKLMQTPGIAWKKSLYLHLCVVFVCMYM